MSQEEVSIKRVVFKAQLGDGPIQIVGDYEFSPEEWNHEMQDFDGDEGAWLQNRGSDWAYDYTHSDCLNYWAEYESRQDD